MAILAYCRPVVNSFKRFGNKKVTRGRIAANPLCFKAWDNFSASMSQTKMLQKISFFPTRGGVYPKELGHPSCMVSILHELFYFSSAFDEFPKVFAVTFC